MSDDVDRCYAKHVAGGPSHVVVAYAWRRDGGHQTGIFSNIAKARAWSDTLSDDEFHGVVITPYVIDVPEFGSVPKEQRQ